MNINEASTNAQIQKLMIPEIVKLMKAANWTWAGDGGSVEVTEDMFKRELKRQITAFKKAGEDVISSGSGGIEIERDSEYPNLFTAEFKITLGYYEV